MIKIIIFAFILLLIVIYFGSRLFGVNISSLALCLVPGAKTYKGLSRSCYMPSKTDGQFCLKKSDCLKGYCISGKENGKGICRDNPTGCVTIIDENGKSKEFGMCFD